MQPPPRASILVVEDSETQAENLRQILTQAGYPVTVADNGLAALGLLEQHRYDLIITDVLMPEMSGYELCRQVKADRSLGEVPVILLTELKAPEDILEGLRCGADNFITKPYDPEVLLKRLDNMVLTRALASEGRLRIGLEVVFNGKPLMISLERQQILNMLIASLEDSVKQRQELVRIEQKIQAQAVEDRAMGQRYHTLMGLVQEGVLVTTAAGVILDASLRILEWTDLPLDQVVGTALDTLVHRNGDDRVHMRGPGGSVSLRHVVRAIEGRGDLLQVFYRDPGQP